MPNGAPSATDEKLVVPRISDIYAALPAITGKLELEYEGEMKGADHVGRELIRAAIAKTYDEYFTGANVQQIVQWFDLGGEIQLADSMPAAEALDNLEEDSRADRQTRPAQRVAEGSRRNSRSRRRSSCWKACTRTNASDATKNAYSKPAKEAGSCTRKIVRARRAALPAEKAIQLDRAGRQPLAVHR